MKGFYIDGRTSKRRNAIISLQNENIQIDYEDDFGYTQAVYWKVSEIHPIKLISSQKSLRYGEFPSQVLDFEKKEDFNSVLVKYPEAEFHKSNYNKFSSFGIKGVILGVFSIIALLIGFFIFGAPAIADIIAQNTPIEYEILIGNNLQETYLSQFEVDDQKTKQIQEFYDELNYNSPYPVEVFVVKEKIVNAFALPGGTIVVFSGILDMMDSPEELAGLLAHEVSHVNERHSLRTMSRMLSTYVLLSAITGDVGGFSAVILENTELISSLSFSRSLEKEADLEGFELMIESNIDPKGMVTLFQKLNSYDPLNDILNNEDEQKDSISINNEEQEVNLEEEEGNYFESAMEILSTHPAPKNRIKYLTKKVESLGARTYLERHDLNNTFNLLKDKEYN